MRRFETRKFETRRTEGFCITFIPPNKIEIRDCDDPPSDIQPIISIDDDLISGISGANISNDLDLISINIADFDITPQQSQFGVEDILRDYTYSLGDVSDNVTSDISLQSVSDLIVQVEDIVTVDLNTDSTFL